MARGIIHFARNLGLQLHARASFSKTRYLKIRQQEIVRVKQENQLIQPGHEQHNQILSGYGDFAADCGLYLCGCYQHTLHAGSGIGKEFW
jgi:hypothetical protein